MTIYYCRNDGGTSAQVNGLFDAAYTGGVNAAYSNFQDALDIAAEGDIIKLKEGHSFLGAFTVPNKGALTSYITVTTTNAASIPTKLDDYPNSFVFGAGASGSTYSRLTPAEAANMPKLKASTALGLPVLDFADQANHWEFIGIEITNDDTTHHVMYNYLVFIGNNSATWTLVPHHILWDHCWVHPIEEVGTMTDYTLRSVESAFICNAHDVTWRKCAIDGFTGWNKYPAPGNTYRLNASCILFGAGGPNANILIEDCLLGANGNNVFCGGSGGYTNPSHVATASSISMNADASGSCTLSSSTDLAVGDMFAIYNATYADHFTSNIPPSSAAAWNVGAVATKTGNDITWDFLAAGFRYRQNIIQVAGTATGGTFTLSFGGQTTSAITYNPSNWTTTGVTDILSALEALSNIVPGDVEVVYDSNYGMTIRMQGAYAYPTAVGLVTVDDTNITGTGDPLMWRNNGPSEGYEYVELPDVPSTGAAVQWKGYVYDGITIQRCIFGKHPEWLAQSGPVKGFVELKNGNNITFNGCIFADENTTLIVTPVNQGGTGPGFPWSEVSNLTVSNSIWTESGSNAIPFVMEMSSRQIFSHDITITNNMFFWPVGHKTYEDDGTIFRSSGYYNVSITHNTIFAEGKVGISYTGPLKSGSELPSQATFLSKNCVMRDNIIRPGNSYFWLTAGGIFHTDAWELATTAIDHNLFINSATFTDVVTNGTTTITSASGFQGVWANSPIILSGGGSLSTTVASVTDGNTLVLTAAANWSSSGNTAVISRPEDYYDVFDPWTGGGWIENSLSNVGFTDPETTNWKMSGDYQIQAGSLYKAGGARQASDGTDVGVNYSTLITALGFNPFTGDPAPGPVTVRANFQMRVV